MERHAAGVVNLAFRFLGSRPDAEEAAQEVFLRLYQRPPPLGPSTKLFTWLYRVTANLCIDLLRKRKTAPVTLSLEEEPPGGEGLSLSEELAAPAAAVPREQVARAELAAAARRAVLSLPFSLRAPLILSTLEGLPHGEIGQILRISPKAVERRLARARELLKARLSPHL